MHCSCGRTSAGSQIAKIIVRSVCCCFARSQSLAAILRGVVHASEPRGLRRRHLRVGAERGGRVLRAAAGGVAERLRWLPCFQHCWSTSSTTTTFAESAAMQTGWIDALNESSPTGYQLVHVNCPNACSIDYNAIGVRTRLLSCQKFGVSLQLHCECNPADGPAACLNAICANGTASDPGACYNAWNQAGYTDKCGGAENSPCSQIRLDFCRHWTIWNWGLCR